MESLETLIPIVKFGVYAGVFGAVLFGAVRIGWKYAPWIILLAFLIFLLG